MSSDHLPSSQYAIQIGKDGQLRVVDDADLPTLLPGYALIKTHAVALNPSDSKISQNFPIPGAFIGLDFSGTLLRTAEDVETDILNLEPGTMVAGAVFQFAPSHRLASGAFAQYVRTPASLLLRVPEPSSTTRKITPLQASTLPTAIATCLLALWSPDALGLEGSPDTPEMSNKPLPVLVYGGSTATGTIAVQLLRLSGYEPIATCSPRNFDLVRGRGASAVFDHASSDVVARIKAHTGGRLKYVLDCISTPATAAMCYEAIQRPGGRYVSLEHLPPEILARRKAVRHSFVLAAEMYGEGIQLGHTNYDRPASLEKHQLGVRAIQMIQRLMDAGQLEPHPAEILDGGLEGVLKGLDVLASGQISGQKLVAVITK